MIQQTDKDIFISTIGHGNRSIDIFNDLLKNYQTNLLVDVRSVPYSRFHPQYRQTNLEKSLAAINIQYLFLGNELGGRPRDPNLYIEGKADYKTISATKEFNLGISKLLELDHSKIKVTLMCSESDPEQCHRKHLIANELIKRGVEVIHINKNGILEKHIPSENLSLFN